MTGSNADEGNPGFNPDVVAAINRAYEEATARLGIQSGHSDRRALLAKCIMDLAKAGTTDETQLRDSAVATVMRADSIRARAHRIWESEGRPGGLQDDHWRRAESELSQEGGG